MQLCVWLSSWFIRWRDVSRHLHIQWLSGREWFCKGRTWRKYFFQGGDIYSLLVFFRVHILEFNLFIFFLQLYLYTSSFPYMYCFFPFPFQFFSFSIILYIRGWQIWLYERLCSQFFNPTPVGGVFRPPPYQKWQLLVKIMILKSPKFVTFPIYLWQTLPYPFGSSKWQKRGFYSIFIVGCTNFCIMKFGFLAFLEA